MKNNSDYVGPIYCSRWVPNLRQAVEFTVKLQNLPDVEREDTEPQVKGFPDLYMV